ncbi:HAMP domain-containing protein [Deinococcus sp. HMF7620]|uniref:histidine kinase n=1 Tax=Deinococcus arboris TaxID=2682977 RepID=A0A7C9LKK1_9DEIO|nr:sensor histidine kinase [Deinococcus arboris]MVN85877.1 HAMP domain-containing protein [Deinococcus arboris]
MSALPPGSAELLPGAAARPQAPAVPLGPGPAEPLWSFLLRPLVLPFALLLGVGGAVVYGVERNDQALRSVLDAQARTQLISDLTQQVAVMENGQRGFVITGQDEFLAPYQEGQATFQAAAYALQDLAVTEMQRTNLAKVQALVGRWQQEAALPEMDARRESLDRAAARVSNGVGRDILNEAREVLAVMQRNETVRQAEATRQSQATLSAVRWISVAGLALGLTLLTVTALRVARTVTRTLRELNDGAQSIARGEYDRRLPPAPVQELSLLGSQFNAMAGAVQDREDQLRRAAHALEQTNTQLERSNRELEQFAYVASHDLQEPLRTIGSYTELLARRYSGQLDERADRYIAFTTAATQRLKTLIQDLLAYSRVRRAERTFAPVDTARLAAQLVEDMQTQIETTGARVTVGPLPTLETNPELLRHALQNLLGNALKFSAPDRAPQVGLTATAEPERWVFHVQDNGIGIAPEYHERIFGVFQRLHGMDEYAGSGIGLAVTRSAAEQLGGELWVDSTPGQGSTFHLALPLTPPTGVVP